MWWIVQASLFQYVEPLILRSKFCETGIPSMFTLPQLKSTLTAPPCTNLHSDPFRLETTPPLPLFDFAAFNFDPVTLSPRRRSPDPPSCASYQDTCGPGLSFRDIDLSSSYWPVGSHDLWPLRVEPAAVWTPSSSTWPQSPPFRWSRWITGLVRISMGLHLLWEEPQKLWRQNYFCDYYFFFYIFQGRNQQAFQFPPVTSDAI